MRLFIGLALMLLGTSLSGQAPDAAEVREQVLRALKGDRQPTERDSTLLVSGAWEALAYLEDTTSDQLYQAVPDYYNFRNGELILKLINPENRNEYGIEMKVPYGLANNILSLYDSETLELRSQWKLLYLDTNYMAMAMNDIYVFFTHTPLQE